MLRFKSVYDALDFAYNHHTHDATKSMGLVGAAVAVCRIKGRLQAGLSELQQCALALRFDNTHNQCNGCGQTVRSPLARHAETSLKALSPKLRGKTEREAIRQAAVMLQSLNIFPEVSYVD